MMQAAITTMSALIPAPIHACFVIVGLVTQYVKVPSPPIAAAVGRKNKTVFIQTSLM